MRQCGKCGSQNLKLKNIKGTKHVWRDYLGIELLCDQNAITCEDCGNLLLFPKDVAALEQNIRSSLALRVKSLLNRINEAGFTQADISEAMGITPEFLSSIKAVKVKVLSFSLFNLLRIYAETPEKITELTGVKPSKSKGTAVTFKGADVGRVYVGQALRIPHHGSVRIIRKQEEEEFEDEDATLDKGNYVDAFYQKVWRQQ